MDTLKYYGSGALFIAHRGLSGLYPENTVAAFNAAAQRKSYFGIETDVHRTADGQYVIMHDVNTSRMTGEEHIIYETEFEVLRNLRIFEKDGTLGNERIPTLDEYVTACKSGNKYSVLELKDKFKKDEVREIIDIVEKGGQLQKTIFISFEEQNLDHVKALDSSLHCQQLLNWQVGRDFFETAKKKGFGVDDVYVYADKEFISTAHSYGIDVNVWTIDSLDLCERVICDGADFITTNIIEKAE